MDGWLDGRIDGWTDEVLVPLPPVSVAVFDQPPLADGALHSHTSAPWKSDPLSECLTLTVH